MELWVWWLIAAAALGLLEMVTLSLVAAMTGVGALAAMVTALVGGGITAQSVVFLVGSLLSLWLLRPVARDHLFQVPADRTGTDALVGAEALVLERVDAAGGRVRLAGEVWSARSHDSEIILVPGRRVTVVRIDGATALVR